MTFRAGVTSKSVRIARRTRGLRLGPFQVLLAMALHASAQSGSTENQVWPEADVYFKLNPQTRFLYTFREEATLANGSGNIANSFYLEGFLPHFHSVFFRRLIRINDARIQRVVLAVGERFVNSVNAHPGTFEARTLLQGTLRWAFPYGSLFTDRNRVEFRFVNGIYTWRARDQLRLEKDIRLHGYALTEYISAEGSFDSKTDSIDRFRFIAGAVFPLGRNTTFEPYFLRQHTLESNQKFLNAAGLRFSLFVPDNNR
jgi:hypothetical protein